MSSLVTSDIPESIHTCPGSFSRSLISNEFWCSHVRRVLRIPSPLQEECRKFAQHATSSLLLTSGHLSRIGRAQKKMLRLIVGWVRISDEVWPDTMHRMKQCMDRCSHAFCPALVYKTSSESIVISPSSFHSPLLILAFPESPLDSEFL